ncbi:hypothetical protein ACDX78_10465 [Virgibacillus oceani]
MAKIKAVKIINMHDVDGYAIGYAVGYDGVKKISDNTIEYPDSIHFVYHVYGENDQVIAEIQNAPLVVEYFDGK